MLGLDAWQMCCGRRLQQHTAIEQVKHGMTSSAPRLHNPPTHAHSFRQREFLQLQWRLELAAVGGLRGRPPGRRLGDAMAAAAAAAALALACCMAG